MGKGNPKGNPQNLKPFVKGEDVRRHIAGRPKKLPQLETILAKVLTEEKNGMEGIEAVITALRNEAIAGRGASKTKAAEILLDRAYGKPVEHVESKGTHIIEVVRTRKFKDEDHDDDDDLKMIPTGDPVIDVIIQEEEKKPKAAKVPTKASPKKK